MKKLLLLLSLMMSLSAFAQVQVQTTLFGKEGGNGGDSRCQEFYKIASEISIALAKVGQTQVNVLNPLIDVALVRKIVRTPFSVLPAKNLNRQAISYPDKLQTHLDVDQWDKIKTIKAKVALVAHELMVLADAEGDGEYAVSRDVLELIKDIPYFKHMRYSEMGASYTVNFDGTVSIYKPMFNGDKEIGFLDGESKYDSSSFRGLCIYFGFKTAVKDSGSYESFYLVRGVVVNDHGYVKSGFVASKKILSVTCTY